MKQGLKKAIVRNLQNLPGWATDRKIVVIESDDWGTIRMSSSYAFDFFMQHNMPVDECQYNRNDALESNLDLSSLFETLSSVKDANGNAAIITANNIIANPDFEKIKSADFEEYFYEPFTTTLKRYPQHDQVVKLYKEGMSKNLFRPQFHGREHLNVRRWLRQLQMDNKWLKMAFSQSMFTVHAQKKPTDANEWLDALDGDSSAELNEKAAILQAGLEIFHSLWGFKPKSFIAPCYIWQSALEFGLAANGIKYLQGITNQLEPINKPGYIYSKKYHYQGQLNSFGQRYLIRNVFFEPFSKPDFDWVDDCLHRIDIAFRWKKPAIICAHRANFIGYIRPKNRSVNLTLFLKLLQKIVQRWPSVEFMTSDQLGDSISN